MSGFICSMVGATFSVAAAVTIIRAKKGIQAFGNAQVSTAQSKFGGASALFDGTNDALLVYDNADNFSFGTGDFTIEMWVRWNTVANNRFYDGRQNLIGNNTILFDYSSNAIRYYTTGGVRISASLTPSAGTWYHFALVRSSGVSRIYINGTQGGSDYSDSTNISAYTTDIGSTFCLLAGANGDGTTVGNSLNGWADEVRISNTARYTTTFTPSTTPFVNDANTLLLIHADGTDGSTFFEDDNGVRDQKGITAVGNAQVSTAQSKFGGSSALFDGTGDALISNAQSAWAFGTGDFTLETWVRFTGTEAQGYNNLITNWSTGSQGFILSVWGTIGTSTSIVLYINNTAIFNQSTGTALALNTWYHITAIRTSGICKIFLNGTQLGSNVSNSANITELGPLGIGAMNGSGRANTIQCITGYLDEIRVSNTARYTTTFTPSTTPFVNDDNTLLLMHCDGTNASTVFRDDNGPTYLAETNSASNISWNWEQYNIYQLSYAGLDSTDRPVFAYAYREISTNYARFILFRVNDDSTITQGSANTITTTAVNSGVSSTVDTDNNYGYIVYNKASGGAYARTFTIDKNNLSIGTVGSEATLYATTDGGMVAASYAGGGRVHYFHRRGGQVSANFYTTRSGTTLTVGTEIVGTVGSSTVYSTLRCFNNSGSLYRHVLISGNGLPQASAIYWNNTSTATASTATSISWGTGSGIRSHSLVRLKSSDKFMILSQGATTTQVVAGTVSWPSSGTSAATVTTGSAVSVGNVYASTYGAADGFADDESYILYRSNTDNQFYYSKVTASGNTLTVLPPVRVYAGSTSLATALQCSTVEAYGKKFIVALADNNGSANPDILVSRID